MEFNHCKIVRDGISGQRQVDEKTFESLAVLGERLERLKKFDKMFESVEFSSAVEKLTKQEIACGV
ncbi:MAG: hypothetical protein KAS69_06975 [Planctomycetes bacterium]|nr:hypothetical protein [Planctomycetota bacterium]